MKKGPALRLGAPWSKSISVVQLLVLAMPCTVCSQHCSTTRDVHHGMSSESNTDQVSLTSAGFSSAWYWRAAVWNPIDAVTYVVPSMLPLVNCSAGKSG